MISQSDVQALLRTYRKELTLILATAVATFLFTKLLPAVVEILRKGAGFLFAVCTGRGKEYRFLRQYLDWVVNANRYSSVIPSQMLDPEKLPMQQRLEDVYIRLQLRSSSEEPTEVSTRALLWPGAKTVILGDPGAGKTTYLRYLALVQANFARSSFVNLRARRRVREQVGVSVSKVPILVPLNRLYRDTAERSGDLLAVAMNALPDLLGRKCPTGFFEKLLERGNALMLLDGLDEIASAEQRVRASAEIAALANAAHSETSWILTSRVVGYKPKLQEHNFQLAMVQHLTEDQVRQFVVNWYANKCEGAGYKPEELEFQRHRHAMRAQHLIDTLVSNVGLRSLATSPMLVSLITMLHSVRLELPENRALLYRDCLELLAGRWDVDRGLAEDQSALRITSSQKITFLTSLAWRMHTEKRREIREQELEDLLSEQLKRIVSSVTAETLKSFIDVLLERSGIIISRGVAPAGDRLLAFSHLSFQEYLVSRWLQTMAPEEADAFVLEKHGDPWWREAILLHMAQLEFPLAIITTIYELVRTDPNIDRLSFVGHCLAEVQADKSSEIFGRVLDDLVFIASASLVSNVSADLLKVDVHNLFLRYLINAVQEIGRLRQSQAQMLLHDRLGQRVDPKEVQASIVNLGSRSDLLWFDRQFVTVAPAYGVPAGVVLPIASRFPGAERFVCQPGRVPVDLPPDTSWPDLIRVAASMDLVLDEKRTLRERASRFKETSPQSIPEFFVALHEDPDEAEMMIHRALCGHPLVVPLEGTGSTATLSAEYGSAGLPRARQLAISAALLQRVWPAGEVDFIFDFVRETLRAKPPRPADSQTALHRALMRRCLSRLQHSVSGTRKHVEFALDCLASEQVDGRDFAFRVLWPIGGLDEEAADYGRLQTRSNDLTRRWGAALVLAKAPPVAQEETVQCLLSQLYEREYRVMGYSLRDVAAYSLMRVISPGLGPSAALPMNQL
jgi:hypothetical protein